MKIKDYNPQITQVNQEILEFKTKRADLEIQLVSTGVDVGPAIYLARTFGTDIDTVVKFFIFILIFVFDPLAVMLVIAYNQALMDRNKKTLALPVKDEEIRDVVSITNGGASAFEEDNERMDIIGQNGNDGLHYDIEEPDVEPREENDPQTKKFNPTPTKRGGVKIK